MLIPNYFESTDILEVNQLPERNYFVPYKSIEEYQKGNRKHSSYYIDLNGIWEFAYVENIRELETPLWLSDIESDQFVQATVPGVWQLDGFDQIQYTNVEYPIPFNPPYVPYELPAGVYRRKLNLHLEEQKDYHINFEGVDSVFYLWVNNTFVGYSTIAHSNTEFDITEFLVDGENTLSVLVLKWATSTYFEDQDKFRFSGIFRDVYLIERDKQRVNSFRVRQKMNQDYSQVELQIEIDCNAESPGEVSLYSPSHQKIACAELSNNIKLSIDNPILWTPETPALYRLVFKVNNEIIVQEVGIREIEIKGVELLLNGVSIKLNGINHHDTNAETGPVVTLEQQRKDIELIKLHNFNAIRTAHYPKNAEFYELCDRLGLLVMSEADMECHGVVELYGVGGNANYPMLVNDPTYEEIFIRRMEASMIPFMNYSSIFMWSGGNESSYGYNFEKAGARARELDSSRPLHFEGYWHRDRQRDADIQYVDVLSRMYASLEEMDELYFNPEKPVDRPFMLCEYAHAMGNGPGDLNDYYLYMKDKPGFVGAFVWEWADHAVNINRENISEEAKYRYGGDFNDYPNFGNFCMDGLVYPDRTPHTGLLEYQQIYRPLRVVKHCVDRKSIVIENQLYFTDASTLYNLHFELYDSDGKLLNQYELDLTEIEPRSSKEIVYARNKLDDFSKVASIIVFYKRLIDNQTVGFDQFFFEDIEFETTEPKSEVVKIEANETTRSFEINSDDKFIRFNKANGLIDSIKVGNKQLLDESTEWSVWRAPVDNDRKIKRDWYQANYHLAQFYVMDSSLSKNKTDIVITFKGVMNSVSRQNFLDIEVEWTIFQDFSINSKVKVRKNPLFPFLPRFGMAFSLNKSIDQYNYLGYGPYENYIDKKNLSYFARFQGQLGDLYEPYIKPQENGAHQIREVSVSSNELGLTIQSDQLLSFNFSEYSTEQLTNTLHRDLLIPEEINYFHIDYQHSGVGSNSCGPELDKKYQLDDEEFTYSFKLIFN